MLSAPYIISKYEPDARYSRLFLDDNRSKEPGGIVLLLLLLITFALLILSQVYKSWSVVELPLIVCAEYWIFHHPVVFVVILDRLLPDSATVNAPLLFSIVLNWNGSGVVALVSVCDAVW